MKANIDIQLSQEELLYLLRSLGLPDLPGMGDRPWGHITQENSLLVMETAGRGLVARGFIHFGSDQIVIEENVRDLLTISAYPQQLVVITHNQGAEASQCNYYHGKDTEIEHRQSYPWIHQFRRGPTGEMGLPLVLGLIENINFGEPTPVFPIPQEKLEEARMLSGKDQQAAADVLSEMGVTLENSEKLTSVLASPKVKILLQAIYELKDPIQQTILSVLADEHSCWLISADQQPGRLAQVMGVDRGRLETAIRSAYLPFK